MGKFLDRLLGKGLESTAVVAHGELDPTGERWTFRSVDFDILIDFVHRTVRITARDGEVTDKREGAVDKETRKGRVDVSIDGLNLSRRAHKKTASSTSATVSPVHATGFSNGVPVSINTTVVTGYSSLELSTGRSALTFTWTPVERYVSGSSVTREGGKVVTQKGYVLDRTVYVNGKPAGGVDVRLDVANDTVVRFEAAWDEGAAPRISAITAEANDLLIAERMEKNTRVLAEHEASRAKVLDVARAAWRAMRDEAGMAGDFTAWDYDATTGAIQWIVAVDKSGKGLFMFDDQRWTGSLAKARAQVVAVEAQDPEKHAPKLHLEIEVRDAEFELAHLKRRRFTMLHGRSRSDLNDWSDRINILGERAAAVPDVPPAA